MKATVRSSVALAIAGVMIVGPTVLAQNPQRLPDRAAGRGGQRPAGPPGGAADQIEVQQMLDAWALVQAQRELQLSEEQYPNFVTRLTRLHNLRRRLQMARRQQMAELRTLLAQSPAKDEALNERIRGLDDLNRRGFEETQKAFAEIDAVLTPWQRGRLRMFEEQVERRKLEMLRTIGAGRGGQPPAGDANRGAGS